MAALQPFLAVTRGCVRERGCVCAGERDRDRETQRERERERERERASGVCVSRSEAAQSEGIRSVASSFLSSRPPTARWGGCFSVARRDLLTQRWPARSSASLSCLATAVSSKAGLPPPQSGSASGGAL